MRVVSTQPPTKKRLKNASYMLAELGIARRTRPELWRRAQAEALTAHPGAPHRIGSGDPIWATHEVDTAIKRYRELGGRYQMPGQPHELLAQLSTLLPNRAILGESKKTKKGEAFGVLTKIVYLSPAWESGVVMCPFFGICGKYCIGHSSGRQVMEDKRRARLAKTALWYLFPAFFLKKVHSEAEVHALDAMAEGKTPAIRMNGSSDVKWERFKIPGTNQSLMEASPGVTWYDYSKIPLEHRGRKGVLPVNYTLTFSVDEQPESWACALGYLAAGHNAAMVVGASWRNPRGKHSAAEAAKAVQAILDRGHITAVLPSGERKDIGVISGDTHDARFKDLHGHWILLVAKGSAAHDSEGFVFRFDREGRLVRGGDVVGIGQANFYFPGLCA
jgi:hypothetical protein